MIERLERELQNWLKRLETFLHGLKHRKVIANFFEAEKIINDYWEILQLVYDEDVLPEMKKQGYDSDIEIEIPKSVWVVISNKLYPALNLITKDASNLVSIYKTDIDNLKSTTKGDLFLIQTTTTDDVLIMFNTIIRGKQQ